MVQSRREMHERKADVDDDEDNIGHFGDPP